jgi:hypothetical protein
LDVRNIGDIRQIEIYTAEAPVPSHLEIEISIAIAKSINSRQIKFRQKGIKQQVKH